MSRSDTTWICASCGARYQEHNPPCKQCAGEEFARLDQQTDDRIGQSADVVYRCQDCGKDHPRRNPPCTNCGGMDLTAIERSQHTQHQPHSKTQRGQRQPRHGHDDDLLDPEYDDVSSSGSWNWLNPPGPFQELRRYTLIFALSTLVIGILMLAGGSGLQALALLYLIFLWPWLWLGLGVMWLLDNIIGYSRHG